KYNALFFGFALLAYIVASPKLRGLLRNPHLYLAALLVVAVGSPVLIWNISNNFASFEFHLVDRHDAGFLHNITGRYIVEFIIQTALMVTPFGLAGIIAYALRPPKGGFERTAWGLATWSFWLSTLAFMVVALTQQLF